MSQEIDARDEVQTSKMQQNVENQTDITELTPPSQTQADLKISEEVSTSQALPAPQVEVIGDYSSEWLSGEEAQEAQEKLIEVTNAIVYGAILYMVFINFFFGAAALAVARIAQNEAQNGNLEAARKGTRRMAIIMVVGFLVSCAIAGVVVYIHKSNT